MKTYNAAPLVLLVDDDEDIRRNATLILSLEGYNVASASNGQEALDMLTSGDCAPNLIVSDIAMPRVDGYALLQAVRQRPALKLTPFIFLTAHGSHRHIRFGRELGVDDYLIKPFDPVDLLAAVRNKLNLHQELRKQVERELDGARRALVQLLSHELRTPLTYITGGFELLADTIGQKGSIRDVDVSMNLIRSGTFRLTRLAEQVVRYAELTSGHARLQLEKLGEKLSLSLLVEAAIGQAHEELEQHHTQIFIEDALGASGVVFGVAELLISAISEVIRNASAYGPDGGSVSIRIYEDEGDGVICVQDCGRGIPPEDQASIWELMIQSERHKHEQQGAGMGLPIVKQTMLLHSGDATLESEPDSGTAVYLRLPLYNQPQTLNGH